MASAENQQHTIPTVPLPDPAGVSGMQDHYKTPDEPRPVSNQTPYLTPYLGLQSRLSQIWINRWTILLLLVLVRVLLSIDSMDDSVGDARDKALSACTKVESAGSALASMPYYMSKGVNEMTATGIEKAVNGLMSMLELTVTGVQQIVIFWINMLTSTYVCLITLVANGAIKAATFLLDETTKFLNSKLPEIGNGIQDAANGFQKNLDSLVDKLNSVPLLSDVDKPDLNLDENLKALDNLQIPTDFMDDVNKLSENLPDFKDVQNFTNSIISLPFEKIKELIRGEIDTYKFDRSLFPVPQKEQLNFCSEGNGLNDFFDSLVHLLYQGKRIFIGVLVVLALVVMAPMAWLEVQRFRKEQARAFSLNEDRSLDPMDFVYLTSRPHTSGFGVWAARARKNNGGPGLRLSFPLSKRQIITRWVVAYATSPPALFVLSLAIAGLFSCLCQFLMLRAVQSQVPDLTDQVAGFTQKVTLALENASTSWQNGTNIAIKSANDDINEKVFGWVDTSTTAVNDTLNGFVDKMSEGIDKVFGEGILGDAIQGVIDCLITFKIQGIQSGLTWVHDHAHVSFPLVANDTFSLGALASMTDSDSDDEFLLAPGQKTKDELSELIDKLVKKFESAILQEVAISLALLGVWFSLLIVAICWGFVKMSRSDKTRAEGGQTHRDDYQPDTSIAENYNEKTYDAQRVVSPPSYSSSTGNSDRINQGQPNPFEQPYYNYDAEQEILSNQANQANRVEIVAPKHLRTSSYAHFQGLSPTDEKDPNIYDNRYESGQCNSGYRR